MSELESERNRFDPDEIVRNSGILWQVALDRRRPISQKVAVAQEMGSIGKDLVRETLDGVSRGNVAPDINFVLKGLSHENTAKFLLVIGGILLASIINSLESGIINGWEDKVFVDNYNSRIIGTPLPTIKAKESGDDSKIPNPSPQEETEVIYKEVKKDPSFLGFFNKGNEKTLPLVVFSFLDSQPSLRQGLYMVVPYYKEAISKLK